LPSARSGIDGTGRIVTDRVDWGDGLDGFANA
jgi:hypothetical protein